MALTFAAATVSDARKDKVAFRLFSSTYTALGTGYQQSLIDGEGASALVQLETYGQWFTMTTATGNAPDEWEAWFIDEICARVSRNSHPERAAFYEKASNRAMLAAFDAYARRAVTVTPATSTESFVYNTLNNRIYVLNHCVRLKPSLLPTIDSVDAALTECLTEIWNRGSWTFARRPVRINIIRTDFTGATWTESTKTITTTGVATTLPVGSHFYVTDGTGATTGDYAVASTTSTTLVLTSSLGSAADGQTDIEGFYVTLTYDGLNASETVDQMLTTKFFYTDSGHESESLLWLDADEFAKARAADADGTGRPRYCRSHLTTSTVLMTLFSPPPDDDYSVRAEVLVRQKADPTSTTDAIPFSSFAAEFMPGVRRMQLDRVLTNYSRTNTQLHKEVIEAIDTLFPQAQSAGEPASRVGVRDVYADRADQAAGQALLGEGI